MKNHTVTILVKDDMVALMAIDQFQNMPALVGRFDGRRQPVIFHQTADRFEDAAELLKTNINISVDRGWRIGWQGQRNYG